MKKVPSTKGVIISEKLKKLKKINNKHNNNDDDRDDDDDDDNDGNNDFPRLPTPHLFPPKNNESIVNLILTTKN